MVLKLVDTLVDMSHFSLDVSSLYQVSNALLVKCTDPSDTGEYAYGKQENPTLGGMW